MLQGTMNGQQYDYGQVIHELETGVRQWCDSRFELSSQVLAPFVKQMVALAGSSPASKTVHHAHAVLGISGTPLFIHSLS